MAEFVTWDVAESMVDLFARRSEELRDRPLPATMLTGADHVILSAAGASHYAALMVQELARSLSRIPIFVQRGYDVPSWIGPRTVFIAISATGKDQELIYSIAAASDQGARCAAITGGSHLHQIASSQGYAEYALGAELDHPVMEIAGVFAALWRALSALLPLNQDDPTATARTLNLQRASFTGEAMSSPAGLVAGVLRGAAPRFYGSPGICAVSAEVWAYVISHALGTPCVHSSFPYIDELSDAQQYGAGLQPDPVVLLLRDSADDELMRARIDKWLAAAIAGPLKDRAHEIIADGATPMERLWSSVYLGVWAACWLSQF